MKAEDIKMGLKLLTTDGSVMEIIRPMFTRQAFGVVAYNRFLAGRQIGQSEICAAAAIQVGIEDGTLAVLADNDVKNDDTKGKREKKIRTLETLQNQFEHAPFACDTLTSENTTTIARLIEENATAAREANHRDSTLIRAITAWERDCQDLVAEL